MNNQQPINPNTRVNPTRNVRRSKILIGCGVTQIALNIFIFGICLNFLFSNDHALVILGSVTLACGVYHIIGGVLAIFGGINMVKNRSCFISCLVLAIVGCVGFVIPVSTMCVMNWVGYRNACKYACSTYLSNVACVACGKVTGYFLPLLLAALLVGINNIILAIVACYNTCKCCDNTGTSNPGVVISQPSYAYHSAEPNQVHAIYPNPDLYYETNPPIHAAKPQPQSQIQLHALNSVLPSNTDCVIVK